MKRIFLITVVCSLLSIFVTPLFATEQVQEDVFASVIVNPVFKLSIDDANISFGFLNPGESVELDKGTYHNVVTCNSNKGRKWYLKISVMGTITGPRPPISPEDFKWKVFRVEGDGIPVDGWRPFSDEPAVTYTSGTQDMQGRDVKVYYQYRLDLPPRAIAGVYSVNVLYTMTDIP